MLTYDVVIHWGLNGYVIIIVHSLQKGSIVDCILCKMIVNFVFHWKILTVNSKMEYFTITLW